jgi:hypothetical protein
MKGSWMLTAVASLTGLLLAAGVAYADGPKGHTDTKSTGKTQVELITPDGASLVGENHVVVHLSDVATGQPVIRDAVRVELTMDASGGSMQGHNHMAGMAGQAPIVANLVPSQNAPGQYAGTVSFTDPGNWSARVIAGPSAAQDAVLFQVKVDKPSRGPNWLVIGGFLGIIVGIAALAFVAKNRAASPGTVADAA